MLYWKLYAAARLADSHRCSVCQGSLAANCSHTRTHMISQAFSIITCKLAGYTTALVQSPGHVV